LYLTNGTNVVAPTSYAQDLRLNSSSNNRITATQYNGALPAPSTFTVAYLSDPNNTLDIYCSPDGVDTVVANTGSGKLLNPFRTITFALTTISAISDVFGVNIHLAGGIYAENVTVTRNNTYIVGVPVKQDINNLTDIQGSVIFNVTGATTATIGGGISFTNMRQFQFTQSQALTGVYTISNCNIAPIIGLIPCIQTQGTATGVIHTANFTNCDINQVTASQCASISLGKCVFQSCDLRTSSAVAMIITNAIGRLGLQYCNLTSAYVGTGFNPLVAVNNTSAVTDGQINYCTLSYTH
jgi:hypothetical protein